MAGSRAAARWSVVIVAAGAAAFAAASSGCTKDPRYVDRPVNVYAPLNCPLAESQAYGVLYAGGDFDPSPDAPPIASLFLRDVGSVMGGLPSATRSLLVDISEPTPAVDWRGVVEIPPAGPINVLVWPDGETCRLTRDVERRQDMTLGVFGHHVMVVGGSLIDGPAVPNTYVGDLQTGILEKLDRGVLARRNRPIVTAFRTSPDQDPSPALVAGGTDPTSGASLDTAEVYFPDATQPGDLGDFDRTRIELTDGRGRAGAAVLATGETLIVGGVGHGGAPLATLEIVDPVTRTSKGDGLALLAFARADPTVVRLASGEILVAGGVDALGQPVPWLEWLSADATHATKRPVELVTGKERGFVPLEAGGALAVIEPDSPTADFKTVWIISADGSLEPGVPIDPNELTHVRLFTGAEGAPVLYDGARWYRWQPWFGAFQPIADAPTGDDAAPISDAIASGDSGLALWLVDRMDAGMNVTGYRFDTKTRFGNVPKPLLIDSTVGLAPDRLAGASTGAIDFEPETGLSMGPGASAFLTDVTLADVLVEVDVVGAPPEVVLRQENGVELEVGGVACAIGQSAKKSLSVLRKGKTVTVTLDGNQTSTCPTELDPTARVSVGLRGSSGAPLSGARNLRVTRR